MAITKASDWKIYDEYFNSGVFESIAQQTNAFNGPSANALRLVAAGIKGNYGYSAFFKDADFISRRDTTSVSAATPVTVTQDEIVSVKLNRKFGPIQMAIDALRKSGHTPEEISFLLGQKLGEQKTKDWLNTALAAGAQALLNQAAAKYDGTAGTMTHAKLVAGLAKMGDAASKVSCWVMHSKAYYDLVQGALTDKIVSIADLVVMAGSTPTLGRPVIVTDAPGLYLDTTTDLYYTLGLVTDGIVVTESEDSLVNSQLVNGLENVTLSLQGEHAFNLALKGFKYDVANGGANPNDAAVATGSNWDLAVGSVKNAAGIVISTQ